MDNAGRLATKLNVKTAKNYALKYLFIYFKDNTIITTEV